MQEKNSNGQDVYVVIDKNGGGITHIGSASPKTLFNNAFSDGEGFPGFSIKYWNSKGKEFQLTKHDIIGDITISKNDETGSLTFSYKLRNKKDPTGRQFSLVRTITLPSGNNCVACEVYNLLYPQGSSRSVDLLMAEILSPSVRASGDTKPLFIPSEYICASVGQTNPYINYIDCHAKTYRRSEAMFCPRAAVISGLLNGTEVADNSKNQQILRALPIINDMSAYSQKEELYDINNYSIIDKASSYTETRSSVPFGLLLCCEDDATTNSKNIDKSYAITVPSRKWLSSRVLIAVDSGAYNTQKVFSALWNETYAQNLDTSQAKPNNSSITSEFPEDLDDLDIETVKNSSSLSKNLSSSSRTKIASQSIRTNKKNIKNANSSVQELTESAALCDQLGILHPEQNEQSETDIKNRSSAAKTVKLKNKKIRKRNIVLVNHSGFFNPAEVSLKEKSAWPEKYKERKRMKMRERIREWSHRMICFAKKNFHKDSRRRAGTDRSPILLKKRLESQRMPQKRTKYTQKKLCNADVDE
ncbi:hypothetical protein [Candidatus Hydrogenosomobacter endosymbioticus]|nr:hypothetical protein [Candidatus Hydrogenosomobacter endosymbioticus]